VAADPIAVIAMNALHSMTSEYECNKAITSNAKKIKSCTPHPGRKALGGRGACTRTPAAWNRVSISMAHITRAVPNIRLLLDNHRGELPFWSLSSSA